jgi:hypothetical protein
MIFVMNMIKAFGDKGSLRSLIKAYGDKDHSAASSHA